MSVTEFYLAWSPSGSAATIPISSAQNTAIGIYRKIKFKTFVFPTSFYSVYDANKTAELSEDGGAWTSFTLTKSNYTASTIVTEIKTALETVGAGTYTVTIDTYTGKLYITATGITSFSIRFTSNSRAHEKIWGILEGTSSPQIPATLSYSSSAVVQLWGPDCLLVKSPTLAKMMAKNNIDVSDGNTNVLMRVPIVSTVFSQDVHFESDWLPAINQALVPNSIVIDITDESGNSIDFNGCKCYLIVAVST